MNTEPEIFKSDWHHSPTHWLFNPGTYCVTAGTYRKEHHFRSSFRLTLLETSLLNLLQEYQWRIQAWAVFSNHYHFVAASDNPETLPKLIRRLHGRMSKEVNELDKTPGRKVFHEYWDTLIDSQKSYYARLNYVHKNAVKHGLVAEATDYRWCSAQWLRDKADPSYRKTIESFKTDQVTVKDDFQPTLEPS